MPLGSNKKEHWNNSIASHEAVFLKKYYDCFHLLPPLHLLEMVTYHAMIQAFPNYVKTLFHLVKCDTNS